MKLRAKKITSNPCLVRNIDSDGDWIDTFHVEGGEIIELNLDDFEVVDPEGLEFVGVSGSLYKIAYQPEPIETPENTLIEMGGLSIEVLGWMKQVTKAINKLQEDR